jgi:hypothetical protein
MAHPKTARQAWVGERPKDRWHVCGHELVAMRESSVSSVPMSSAVRRMRCGPFARGCRGTWRGGGSGTRGRNDRLRGDGAVRAADDAVAFEPAYFGGGHSEQIREYGFGVLAEPRCAPDGGPRDG